MTARGVLVFALAWTLALLLLGSIVHATESSLACPDWPTCFGTMMPEMTGGVFWEHLHRLWAGALVLIFASAVVLVRRQLPGHKDLFRMGIAGLVLLLIQSVLGGLTVIYRLPDAISTSHLALAFAFVALVTIMVVRSGGGAGGPGDESGARELGGVGGGRRGEAGVPRERASALPFRAGVWTVGLVFAQSVVGALVRHTDAGMACPDVPLCLGRVIPPLEFASVQLHFAHRALGIAVAAAVLGFGWRIWRSAADPGARGLTVLLGIGVVVQVLLGFLSVAYRLAVPFVSAHTLVAAGLISLGAALAAHGQPACARGPAALSTRRATETPRSATPAP